MTSNNQLAIIPARPIVVSNQQRKPNPPSKKTIKKEVSTEVKKLANETRLSLKPTKEAYEKVRAARRLYDIKTNQYLLTLFNPFDNKGVRIPDLTAYPSSTFTVEWNTTLVPGLVSGKYQNQLVFYPQLFNCILSSSTANYVMNGGQSSPNASQISTTYKLMRPVSAGLVLKWAGAPMTARGEIGLGLVPWGQTYPATWADLLALRGSQSFPVLDGATAVWVPMDPSALMYRQSQLFCYDTTGAVYTYSNINYVGFMGTPGIMVALNDVDSAGYLEVRAVINFEGIPNLGTWMPTQTQMSPVNMEDLSVAHTVAAAAKTSIKGISPKSLLNDALRVGKGMLQDAISKGIPILGGALSSFLG